MLMIKNDGVEFSTSTISKMNAINLISCMLIFIRTFFLFRVLSSLRPLIRMIKEVLSGLMPFTTILSVSCLFFSVIVYLVFDRNVHQGKTKKVHAYSSIAKDQISIIASGEYSSANMPTTKEGFVMYFIAYYITVVCLMNLLIAIITERYQIVLEQTVPMECIERCVLMSEIEGFVNFFKKFGKGKGDGV